MVAIYAGYIALGYVDRGACAGLWRIPFTTLIFCGIANIVQMLNFMLLHNKVAVNYANGDIVFKPIGADPHSASFMDNFKTITIKPT